MPAREEMERRTSAPTPPTTASSTWACDHGMFCRPSCSARKPKPENVEFFGIAKDAVFTGYRPCLRCHPLEDGQAPPWVAPLMDRIERQPDERIRERELRQLGVEPARVRRYFEARYGLTFQAYCRARRLSRAFERIREGEAIDDAVFERLRVAQRVPRRLPEGVRRDTRPGRRGRQVSLAWMETPLGPMIAGASDAGCACSSSPIGG